MPEPGEEEDPEQIYDPLPGFVQRQRQIELRYLVPGRPHRLHLQPG